MHDRHWKRKCCLGMTAFWQPKHVTNSVGQRIRQVGEFCSSNTVTKGAFGMKGCTVRAYCEFVTHYINLEKYTYPTVVGLRIFESQLPHTASHTVLAHPLVKGLSQTVAHLHRAQLFQLWWVFITVHQVKKYECRARCSHWCGFPHTFTVRKDKAIQ